jgi:FkbM family methyltransferase
MLMNKISKLLNILKKRSFSAALLKHRVAVGVEHMQVLEHLGSLGIKTILDVGANRGQFALAARAACPGAAIFSFEPLQEPAEVFQRVFAGDRAVRLHQVAIGEAASDAVIHVSQSDDSSSLLPISELQTALFPNTGEKETRQVQIRRLPDVVRAAEITQPALLKIDVQGYEKEVLAGVGSLIQAFAWIYVECSFMELYSGQTLAHDVIAMLAKRGFRLDGVYNLSYDRNGLAIQGDFLFVNTKEASA